MTTKFSVGPIKNLQSLIKTNWTITNQRNKDSICNKILKKTKPTSELRLISIKVATISQRDELKRNSDVISL